MEKEEALGWRGEMERCCIQTSSTHSLTTPFALIVLAQLTRPTHFQLKRKKERKKKRKKGTKKRKNRLVFTILTVARAQSYQKENKTRKLIARIKIRRVPILAQKKEKEKEIINE